MNPVEDTTTATVGGNEEPRPVLDAHVARRVAKLEKEATRCVRRAHILMARGQGYAEEVKRILDSHVRPGGHHG